jgi:competence protein ComEA
VGPALAARIVAEREAKGPFGSLDSLRARIKGIGPAMIKTLESRVVFYNR